MEERRRLGKTAQHCHCCVPIERVTFFISGKPCLSQHQLFRPIMCFFEAILQVLGMAGIFT